MKSVIVGGYWCLQAVQADRNLFTTVQQRRQMFTAIDAEKDDVLACLKLFRSLQEQFPDQFPSYANLAIAIAVTWDNP